MAKKKLNIKSAIKRPGALTKKAKNKGMTVPKFTEEVKSNPNSYSTLTKQQANFANLLASFKKKANGGFGNPGAVSSALGAAGDMSSGLAPKQGSFGNIAGDALSGAATGAMFGPWGAVAGAGVGIAKGLIEAGQEKKEKKKFDAAKTKADLQNSMSQQDLFAQNFTTTGTDTGFNRGSSFSNSYLGPQQMMRTGGKRKQYGNGGPEDEAMTIDTSQSQDPGISNMFQGAVVTTDANTPGAQPMGYDPNSQTFMPSVTFPEFDAAVEEIPRDAQGERMFSSNQQKDNFYAFQNMGASGLADMRAMKQGVKGATAKAAQNMAAPLNLDNVQYGLMGLGLTPGVGVVPDLANTGISLARAGYNKVIGDQEAVNKNMVNAGINAFAAIPGIGLGAPGLKAAQVMAPGATRVIQATANLGPKAHNVFHGAEYVMQGMHGIKSANHFQNEASRLVGQTQMKTGGKALPGGEEINLPNGAKKYIGNKHGQSGRGSKSGILVDPKTEVTHNETKDKIVDNQGKAMEYFFSPEMRTNGKSFAKRHEEILKSGGTRANIQKELQRLAKLQEDHANKHHGEKHRDGKQIMETGGVKKYVTGGDGQPTTTGDPTKEQSAFDMSTLQKDKADALKAVPTGQHEDTSGKFGGITDPQVQETVTRNPWYDWSNFDVSNTDSVIEFQRAFNALSPTIKLKEDGKFGQQTQSAYIPVAKADAIQDANPTPEQKVTEETTEQAVEQVEEEKQLDPDKDNTLKLEPPKLRDVPPLAYLGMAAQAVGPIAALLKDSPKASEVDANLQGKEKLNRFDFDAERAQNLGNTVAFNRAIEGSGAGPAGIASMIAANSKSNQNALAIANKEAQVNKSQSDAETALNQRIAEGNIARQYDADVRNTTAKAQRDMYEYEKDLSAVDALGNLAASGAKDVLAYKRDERVAGANQIAGEYTRQRYFEKLNSSPKYRRLTKGMTDQEKRRIAAAMYDNSQTLEELDQSVIDYYNNLPEKDKKDKEEKRTGGYTARYGKIKKRR